MYKIENLCQHSSLIQQRFDSLGDQGHPSTELILLGEKACKLLHADTTSTIIAVSAEFYISYYVLIPRYYNFVINAKHISKCQVYNDNHCNSLWATALEQEYISVSVQILLSLLILPFSDSPIKKLYKLHKFLRSIFSGNILINIKICLRS